MKTSEQTDLLDAALALAQAEIEPALKDSNNPHFKSKYSDFKSVREVSRKILGKYGIAIVQEILTDLDRGLIGCQTRISHKGQWMLFDPLWVKPARGLAPQDVGSCATYLQRYTYKAALGISSQDEDDDAEQGEGRGEKKTQKARHSDDHLNRVKAMLQKFKTIGVTQDRLEELLKCGVEDFNDDLFAEAQRLYSSIQADRAAQAKAGLNG